MLSVLWNLSGNCLWRYRLNLLLLCVAGLMSRSSPAQTAFRHLTTSNGLSHNTVMNLLQDHKGFLWLGTADGLNRYDGERF